MKLTIEIKLDNAAFEGDNGIEIARILRKLAAGMDGTFYTSGDSGDLRDHNGNTCGKWKVTK